MPGVAVTPELNHLFDEVRGAWRFRYVALVAAFAVASLAGPSCSRCPTVMRRDAQVFVDTSTALKPALQGLTIGPECRCTDQLRAPVVARRSAIGEDREATPGSVTVRSPDERARAKVLDNLTSASPSPCRAPATRAMNAARQGPFTAFDTWIKPRPQPCSGRDAAQHLRWRDPGREARGFGACTEVFRDPDQGLRTAPERR